MKKLLLATFGLIAIESKALDGVWTNQTTSAVQNWNVAGSWTDADGNPLGGYPAAAGDTAVLSPISSYALQTIYLGWADFTLGSVAGTFPQTLSIGSNQTPGYNCDNNADYNAADKVYAVGDWRDFAGYVEPTRSSVTLKLPAAGADGRGVWAFSTAGAPAFEVTDAGTKGVIENIYKAGATWKKGAGELVVRTTDNGNNVFYVDKGTLTLGGGTDAELAAVLAKAAVHFDASQTNAITHAVAADGYDAVSEWRDVRGNGVSALPANYPGKHPFLTFARTPFLSAARSPTGLPFVDFGARHRDAAEVAVLGPTNCCLRMSKGFAAREIFVAADIPRDLRGVTAVGDNNTYHLVPDVSYDRFVQFGGGDAQYLRSRNGDLTLNGAKITDARKASTVTGMNVYSISPLAAVNVSLLGTGCYYAGYTGGLRLGETLVFTNVLTRAERVLVNQYLLRKWKGTHDDRMAATVFAANDATVKIGVPDDARAHVGTIVAAGATVSKTGAGELVVDRVTPASATLSVAEGSLAFGATGMLAKKVAENPYIWLDARTIDAAGKMSFDGNPTNYVHSWKDCRAGVSTAATGVYTTAPRMAFLIEDAVGPGKPAVSFGNRAKGSHSHMQFPNWASASTYAVFAVARVTDASKAMPVFGSSTLATMRSEGRPLSRWYKRPVADAARWAINGIPVNPRAEHALLKQTEEFLLISLSSDTEMNIGGIAGCRTSTYPNECGDWEVAEMIVYDHAITEQERRETEAYLMDRWLGKEHPAAAYKPSKVTYAASVAPVLSAEGDMEVGTVEAASGTFVKRGAGTLTVGRFSGVQSLDVAAGGLVVKARSLDDFGPTLHLDAMRSDLLTTSVSEDKTNVTAWTSSVGSVVALSKAGDSTVAGGNLKHPTLQTVETAVGDRSVVDFGELKGVKAVSEAMTSASMAHGTLTVREVHEIVADNATGGTRQAILCNSSDYSWLRGSSGKIFEAGTYLHADTLNGYIAVDGIRGTVNSVIASGLRLASVAPLSARPLNWMCNDRYGMFGGLKIGEQIAFDRELTAVERAYVQESLMAKWLGGAAPSWTNEYDAVSVAVGSTLTFEQGVVKTSSVSGAGMLNADLAGVSTIDLDWTESPENHLTVNGAASFAGAVTVRIAAGKNLPYGDHVVLSASSVVGFVPANWSLSTDSRVPGAVKFLRSGNDVLLRHDHLGLTVIIR